MRIEIDIADPGVLGLDAIQPDAIDGARIVVELRLPGLRVGLTAMAEEVGVEYDADSQRLVIRANAVEASTTIVRP